MPDSWFPYQDAEPQLNSVRTLTDSDLGAWFGAEVLFPRVDAVPLPQSLPFPDCISPDELRELQKLSLKDLLSYFTGEGPVLQTSPVNIAANLSATHWPQL